MGTRREETQRAFAQIVIAGEGEGVGGDYLRLGGASFDADPQLNTSVLELTKAELRHVNLWSREALAVVGMNFSIVIMHYNKDYGAVTY